MYTNLTFSHKGLYMNGKKYFSNQINAGIRGAVSPRIYQEKKMA